MVIEIFADEVTDNCNSPKISMQFGGTAADVSFEVACRWDEMSEPEQQKWKAWARDLKGWPEDDESPLSSPSAAMRGIENQNGSSRKH